MGKFIPIIEVAFGLVALVLTAMAFMYLSWSQGMSDARMQLASRQKTRRLFYWAGGFWALTVICLCLTMFVR
jgi:hypothetical protein